MQILRIFIFAESSEYFQVSAGFKFGQNLTKRCRIQCVDIVQEQTFLPPTQQWCAAHNFIIAWLPLLFSAYILMAKQQQLPYILHITKSILECTLQRKQLIKISYIWR